MKDQYVNKTNEKEGQRRYKDFLNKYRQEHYFCPNCHSKNYISTIMSCVFDEEHPEEYKDRNLITCNLCGWKGISHDLLPKTENTGFKICYWDQLIRCHIYNDAIYNFRNDAELICQQLNDNYKKKNIQIEFHPYEIDINYD